MMMARYEGEDFGKYQNVHQNCTIIETYNILRG